MTLTATVEWGMCARSETNGCPVAVVIRVVVVCVVARCVGGNFAEAPERANHCSTFEETGLITLHVRERARNRKWDTRQLVFSWHAHTFGPTSKTGTFRVGWNTANVSQRVLWSTQRPRLHNQTPTPLACDTACVLVLLICGATFDEPNQRQCRQ